MKNEALKQDLILEFMPEVEEIVRELDNGSLPLEDLIQEGMVGLVEALEELPDDREEWGEEPLDSLIRRCVLHSAREAQNAHESLGLDELRLVAEVERLSKSIDRLTEETGEKPNIDELANDMKISQRKVLDILKLTGETPDEEAFLEPERNE